MVQLKNGNYAKFSGADYAIRKANYVINNVNYGNFF